MKDFEKILGAAFLLIAVVHLFRRDWLGFAVTAFGGTSMLLPRTLKLPPKVELALGIVAVILVLLMVGRAVARFVS